VKPRPAGFLANTILDHQDEVFDYICELHNYLWRFIRLRNPGASGNLADEIDRVLEPQAHLSSLSRADIATQLREWATSKFYAGHPWLLVKEMSLFANALEAEPASPTGGINPLMRETEGLNVGYHEEANGTWFVVRYPNQDVLLGVIDQERHTDAEKARRAFDKIRQALTSPTLAELVTPEEAGYVLCLLCAAAVCGYVDKSCSPNHTTRGTLLEPPASAKVCHALWARAKEGE